jgi:hypothetical protein
VLTHIPYLTQESISQGKIRPGSLVRYRGMVQDVFDPEYFVGVVMAKNLATGTTEPVPTKYSDVLQTPNGYEFVEEGTDQDRYARTMGRLPLFLVPVPGESDWVKREYNDFQSPPGAVSQGSSGISAQNRKRSSADTDDVDMDGPSTVPSGLAATTAEEGKERPAKRAQPLLDESSAGNKQSPEAPAMPLGNRSLLFPLGKCEKGIPCLAKVYDCDGNNTSHFRVNTVIEFVGIFSADPVVNANMDIDGDTKMEDGVPDLQSVAEIRAHNPPPSVVPRLHCLSFRPLHTMQHKPHTTASEPDTCECFQALPFSSPGKDDEGVESSKSKEEGTQREKKYEASAERFLERVKAMPSPLHTGVPQGRASMMKAIRHVLMGRLTSALGGDAFAAQHVLLHMLSRVRTRSAMMTVGTFSLNIFGFKHFPATLLDTVRSLMTRVAKVNMSIEHLNSKRFAPVKDYEMNRLLTGPFQLVDGTYIVCDETVMDKGKLNDNGCKNLRSIQRLGNEQKVMYDFQYHEMEWNVDAPLLIVSDGRSIVKSTVFMPLCAKFPLGQGSDQPSQESAVPEDVLNLVREYLSIARYAPLNIPPSVASQIEQSFVQARMLNSKVTAHNMHLWLCMARLLALSHGETELTTERWEESQKMEQTRRTRVSEVTGTNTLPPAKSP